jgi:hypothetical protein
MNVYPSGRARYIPEPADFPYSSMEPMAVVAKRGQALIFTQSMLHAGWRNIDTVPRKGLIVSFAAAEVLFGSSLGGIFTGRRAHFSKLHAALANWAPGREHIVPTGEEVHPFPSSATERFEETFMVGRQPKL